MLYFFLKIFIIFLVFIMAQLVTSASLRFDFKALLKSYRKPLSAFSTKSFNFRWVHHGGGKFCAIEFNGFYYIPGFAPLFVTNLSSVTAAEKQKAIDYCKSQRISTLTGARLELIAFFESDAIARCYTTETAADRKYDDIRFFDLKPIKCFIPRALTEEHILALHNEYVAAHPHDTFEFSLSKYYRALSLVHIHHAYDINRFRHGDDIVLFRQHEGAKFKRMKIKQLPISNTSTIKSTSSFDIEFDDGCVIRFATHPELKRFLGFTQVAQSKMQELGGIDMISCMEALIYAGVVTCDRQYVKPGDEKPRDLLTFSYSVSHARHYQINPSFCQVPFKKPYDCIEVDDADLIIREREYRQKQALLKHLNTAQYQQMHVEVTKAFNWIDFDELREYYYSRPKEFYGVTREEDLLEIITKFGHVTMEQEIHALEVLQVTGELYFNDKDGFGFRFHSVFTNMRSSIRKFVKKDGVNYINVDIKNSQMVLLGVLFTRPDVAKRLFGDKGVFDDSTSDKLYDVYEFFRSRCWLNKKTADQFYNDAQAGELYQIVADSLGISRKEAKQKMMELVFSDSKTYRKQKRELDKIYPGISRLANNLNRADEDISFCPKFAQIAESSLMLQEVWVEFAKVKKHEVVTIHDSFLMHPADYDAFMRVWSMVFDKYGLAEFPIHIDEYEYTPPEYNMPIMVDVNGQMKYNLSIETASLFVTDKCNKRIDKGEFQLCPLADRFVTPEEKSNFNLELMDDVELETETTIDELVACNEIIIHTDDIFEQLAANRTISDNPLNLADMPMSYHIAHNHTTTDSFVLYERLYRKIPANYSFDDVLDERDRLARIFAEIEQEKLKQEAIKNKPKTFQEKRNEFYRQQHIKRARQAKKEKMQQLMDMGMYEDYPIPPAKTTTNKPIYFN